MSRVTEPSADRRGRSGFVLPSTLMVTSVLLVVMVALIAVARLELKSSTYNRDLARARYAALAGLALAETRLTAVRGYAFDYGMLTGAENSFGVLNEDGVDLGTDALDLGDAGVTVTIRDECALVDLNHATRDELVALPGMGPELADPILDWRDADNETREYGAEADWYAQLDPAYPAKDGPFDTVDELRLLKGFTKNMLLGAAETPGLERWMTVWADSPDTAPDGEPKLDLSAVSAAALQARLGARLTPAEAKAIAAYAVSPGFERLGQILSVTGLTRARAGAIVDYITVGPTAVSQGKVNLNTASADVLGALPGASADVAAIIIRAREDGPFTALSGFVALADIPAETVGRMIDRLTVGSRRFGVAAEGRAGRARIRLFAIYEVAEGEPRLVYASYHRPVD